MSASRLLGGLLVLVCAAVLAASGRPGDAAAASPEEAIAYANQQRAAYGIPPLILDQSLLKPECNLADHEIASPSTEWSATSNPWDAAPWHEETLFNPEAAAASYGEYNGFASDDPTFASSGGTWACMWFRYLWQGEAGFPPNTPEAHLTFYWAAEAPGPGDVAPSVSAFEWPHSPAEEAGLSNPSGPNLIVYAATAGLPLSATAREATVTSAGGVPVPAHLVHGYRNDAVVVIDKPVQPFSAFSVSVNWEASPFGSAPTMTTQSFSFTTGADSSAELAAEPTPSLPVSLRIHIHGSTIRLTAPRVVFGHRIDVSTHRTWVPCALRLADKRCTWVRKGHGHLEHRRIKRGLKLHFRPPNPWEKVRINVRTRGFTRHGRKYAPGYASVMVSGPKPKHIAR